MGGAGHTRRVGLQERLRHAKIERSPAASALALVVAGTAPVAHWAAPLAAPGRPHARDDRLGVLVVQDLLDHGVLDTKQPLPYPRGSHAVSTPCGTSLRQLEP